MSTRSTESAHGSGPEVFGLDLDAQTRCRHYHGPTDIIAIKMKCCGKYYACKDCHEEQAGHAIEVWPRPEWLSTKAVVCGACKSELTVSEYFECEAVCPKCSANFNPRCSNHYHFYFEIS